MNHRLLTWAPFFALMACSSTPDVTEADASPDSPTEDAGAADQDAGVSDAASQPVDAPLDVATEAAPIVDAGPTKPNAPKDPTTCKFTTIQAGTSGQTCYKDTLYECAEGTYGVSCNCTTGVCSCEQSIQGSFQDYSSFVAPTGVCTSTCSVVSLTSEAKTCGLVP